MTTKSKLGVALVKEACKVCGALFDGPIIMNTRLSTNRAQEVEDMHGKVIGFREQPCDQCQQYMEQGIVVVTIDPEKTEDFNNPWRTGGFWVLKDEAVKRIVQGNPTLLEAVLKERVMFIIDEVAQALGLAKQ